MRLFGPVFKADLALQARRPRTYVVRTAALGLLLLGFAATYVLNGRLNSPYSTREAAVAGRQIYTALAATELTLVLCLAPVLAAGALVNERTRGTLQHTFVTDLTNREIVYGAWAARTFPLLALIAASFPVLWLSALLGGISAQEILKLYAVLFGCTLLLTSFCLFASLWAKRTSDVLIACFAGAVIWSMSPLMQRIAFRSGTWPGGSDFLSPYGWVFAIPIGQAPPVTAGVAVALPLASIVMVERTARRIRQVVDPSKAEDRLRGRNRRTAEPDLDARPVEWLEWARNRRSVAQTLTLCMLFVFCGIAILAATSAAGRGFGGPAVVAFASLAFGLTGAQFFASTAVGAQCSDDRDNRHFEMLGMTMLEPHEVLSGRSARFHRSTVWACAFAICFSALCMTQSLRAGFLCALMVTANFVAFSKLFAAASIRSALTFGRQVVGIGVATAAFVVLTAGLPAVVTNLMRQSHLTWGLLQTGPFFSYVLGGRLGIEPEFLGEHSLGIANVVWSFCVAGACYGFGAVLDERNKRLLGRRMRGEP